MPNKDRNIPKRRFKAFENADAWELRKLGDIGEIVTGSTPPVANPEYYSSDTGIPWITPTDIETNIISDSAKKLSVEGAKVGRVVQANSILCTCIASIGKNALLTTIGSFNQQINALTPYPNNDSYFLLTSSELWSIQMKQIASSGTMQIINKTEFSELRTMIPSLPEQEAIGTFFSALDRQITLHQRKLDKLKHVKQAYLSEMFPAEGERVPKRRFPGFTDDWELRKLGECSSLITKGTTPRDKSGVGDVNFVKVENLVNGEILPLQKIQLEEHEGYLKRSQLVENDILFSIAGTLGRTAVVKKSILPANTNQALSIIRGYEFNKNFLVTILRGNVIKEFIKKNPTIGAQPNLSLEQVSNLCFSAPCTEEQSAIGTFFSALDQQITLHQRKLEKLKNLKKALLNELFV
ncbi:TPA: restriction endonuclease subunit S [Streptococcus suis]